jgi:hypothetical protein
VLARILIPVLAPAELQSMPGNVDAGRKSLYPKRQEFLMDTSAPGTSTTAGTIKFRSIALAGALFVAPWGFVVANGTYAWITRTGGSDLTGADALTLAAAHPGAYRLAMVMAMVGSLLMVPAAIGAMRLTHRRAARLGLIGGLLVAGGYICYFALVRADTITLAMAARGDHLADYAKAIDGSLGGASAIWVNLTFLIGNIVGTFLLGLALLRSRSVYGWACWGVLAWSVLHIAGIVLGTELFEVAGALAQALGFAGVAVCLLRQAVPAEASPVLVRRPRKAPRSDMTMTPSG